MWDADVIRAIGSLPFPSRRPAPALAPATQFSFLRVLIPAGSQTCKEHRDRSGGLVRSRARRKTAGPMRVGKPWLGWPAPSAHKSGASSSSGDHPPCPVKSATGATSSPRKKTSIATAQGSPGCASQGSPAQATAGSGMPAAGAANGTSRAAGSGAGATARAGGAAAAPRFVSTATRWGASRRNKNQTQTQTATRATAALPVSCILQPRTAPCLARTRMLLRALCRRTICMSPDRSQCDGRSRASAVGVATSRLAPPRFPSQRSRIGSRERNQRSHQRLCRPPGAAF